MKRIWVIFIAVLLPFLATALPLENYSTNLASLISPAKLVTLGKGQANARLLKAIVLLEEARRDSWPVGTVASKAIMLAGYTNLHLVVLTQSALTQSHEIATKLGALDDAGLEAMRQGKPPTITKGPHQGDKLSVVHIVPVAVAPELDNVMANLELRPLKLGEAKKAKMEGRQFDYAKQFRIAGLLSTRRLEEILIR